MPPKSTTKKSAAKSPNSASAASSSKPSTPSASATKSSPNKSGGTQNADGKKSTLTKAGSDNAGGGKSSPTKAGSEQKKKGVDQGKKKKTDDKGKLSDDESSVGSNSSVGSRSSQKSNSSVKSNNSKMSKSTTKSGVSATKLQPTKQVQEVTGQQLMAAVNDFDKKALLEYLEFHKEAGPLPDNVLNFTNNGGNTPLMMACQKPKDADAEALVKILLEMKPNLDCKSRAGFTALHYAVKDQGLPNTVQLLLEAGAEFQIKNSEGFLPSDLAKERRIVQTLRHYLELRIEAQRLAAVAELGIVLWEAVAANDIKAVKQVIGRDPPEETYSYAPEPREINQPSLRMAVDRNYLELVRMLVVAGADGKQPDRLGRTPTMHLCAQKRMPSYPTTKLSREKEAVRWTLLQALLDGPGNHLECRDKNGETAFHLASNSGYFDDMRLLVEVGADVNARIISPYPYRGYPSQRQRNGDTALIVACRKGDMATVKALLEDCKADPNIHGAEGMTGLMWAAWHDRKELVSYLHDKGANINAQSYFGQTALMWTMEHMRVDTAMFLLDLGYNDPEPVPEPEDKKGGSKNAKTKPALMKKDKNKNEAPPPPPEPKTAGLPPRAADPNLCTKNNASPLLVLARKAKSPTMDPKLVSACIDLLISRGANVDIRSTDGLTALMWSVINNDKDICRQLLFCGADPTIKDNLRLAPLDVALSTVIKMLLKNAVEAFNEAKAEREKREAELAADMKAQLEAAAQQK